MNNFITFTIYFYQCLKHQLNICVEYKLLNVATKLLLKIKWALWFNLCPISTLQVFKVEEFFIALSGEREDNYFGIYPEHSVYQNIILQEE